MVARGDRPRVAREVAWPSPYLVTPRVAKHRFFVWLPVQVWPDSRLYAIAKDDNWTFGVLSSRIHTAWALANASRHGDGDDGGRPTYNAKSCFETFPFPLYSRDTARLMSCAIRFDQLRSAWLNPPEWVQFVSEVRPIDMRDAPYPDRAIAKLGFERHAAGRTLTNLYNDPPPWLPAAQAALDRAVATAYGWRDYSEDLPDSELVARIARLNFKGNSSL